MRWEFGDQSDVELREGAIQRIEGWWMEFAGEVTISASISGEKGNGTCSHGWSNTCEPSILG
jgi:hypothetical protein